MPVLRRPAHVDDQHLVVLAALNCSKDADPPDRPTVRVETWRLATLSGIEISDADDDSNGDAQWATATPGAWPYRSRATLRFEGRTEALILPLSLTATDNVRGGLERLFTHLHGTFR